MPKGETGEAYFLWWFHTMPQELRLDGYLTPQLPVGQECRAEATHMNYPCQLSKVRVKEMEKLPKAKVGITSCRL